MYPELNEPSFGSFVASLNHGINTHTQCEVDVLRRTDGARGLGSYVSMTARGIRKSMTERNYDLVHGHYVGVAAGVAWTMAQILRTPLILTAHGSDVESAQAPPTRFIHQQLYGRCSGLHFVSEPLRSRAEELLGGWEAPTLVAPTGVDLSRFSPEGERHLTPSRRKRILMVGQTVAHKGWEDGIRALALVRQGGLDVELLALGGPRHEWLKELAHAHGVADALICGGEVEHHQLATYYRGADIVLVASHREGFGLVGLEAMACGTGLVSTGVGGMRAYTEHNRNAWVVQAQNPKSIADGLTQMLTQTDLRVKLEEAGLETVQEFSVKQTALKLEAFYQRILSART
jgi:glycosyltransferase involved in cell wall biosynthesis